MTVPHTGQNWGGLRWDNTQYAVLEGSTGAQWWYAIGSFQQFSNANVIPGPDGKIEIF